MFKDRSQFDFIRNQLKGISKEVFWITAGQFVFVLGSIFSVKILTNLLTPTEYGKLALALTIVGLGGQIYIGPISQGALRYYSVSLDKKEFSNFVWGVFSLFKKGTYIFLGIGILATITLSSLGYNRWVGILLMTLLISSLHGVNKIVGNIQNAARNRIIVAWHDGSLQWLKVGFAYLFVIFMVAQTEIVLSAFVFATVLILVSQVYFLKRNIIDVQDFSYSYQKENVKKWISSIFSYSWPFFVWGIFIWGQTYGDKWLLGATLSSYSVGLYAVLYKIGFQPAVLLSNLSNRILAPIFFARIGDFEDMEKVKQTFNYHLIVVGLILGITLLASGITFLLNEFIFDLVVARKYHEVSSYLWLMVLAGGMYATAEIGVLNLMATFDTKKLLVPKIGGAVIAIISYYIGSYLYGIYGLVIANLIYTFIYLLIISGMIYSNYGTIKQSVK